MRRFPILLCAALCCAAAVPAAQSGTRAMSGWFNVSTPEGWSGRRYMDGSEIFAEEFDSNADGRIDIWRFYRRGILTSEERDLKGEGKINFQSRWEPRERRLLLVQRDTDWRGINDLEIESTGSRRWEIREDRNQDGVTDRILIANGPSDLFERLGMDLFTQRDIIDNIPREYWYELWSDDTFTGTITDYRRFSRGEFSQYGEWQDGKVTWRKVTPDFVPPPPSVAVSPPPGYVPPASTGAAAEPYADSGEFGGYAPEPYADPGVQPFDGPVQPTAPAARDRTRYEGLPPGDSSARSLPAPMRPPGVGPR